MITHRASVLISIAFMLVRSAAAATGDVTIPMSDGVLLKGTYFNPGRTGPAVLLLPQCNTDRKAWASVAADLSASGMHVLSIDFRGLGESGGRPTNDDERRTLTAKWPADVDATLAFLLAQQGVDSTRLAIGGASCGVPQASTAVLRQDRVRALIVLSGPALEAAKRYIAAAPGLAVFGAVAEQDDGALQGIKDLVGASHNTASLLKVYKGAAHGTELFGSQKDLQPTLVTWLAAQLVSK